MDKLTNLLKEHQVGEWCKRAAWIIAALGLIEIVLTTYNLISQLQMANTSYYPLNTSNGQFDVKISQLQWVTTNYYPPNWEMNMVYGYLFPLLFTIAQLIFFFFVLYAAGTFLNHFVTDTGKDNKKSADELGIEEEEYLKPGQFTEIE